MLSKTGRQQRQPWQTGSLGSSVLRRKCTCGTHTGGGGCAACAEKQQVLRRKATNDHEPTEVPPIVYDVLRSAGQPLDPDTRAFFEPRFGHDFSGVRVHSDAKAVESARAIHALAYTVGADVVFGEGTYAPATSDGRLLLAHELVHTVQGSDSNLWQYAPSLTEGRELLAYGPTLRVQQTGASEAELQIATPDGAFEHEAEVGSGVVMQGRQAPRLETRGPSVLRRKVSTHNETQWETDHPEGRWEVDVVHGINVHTLWNFAVGRSDLKPEHEEVLAHLAKSATALPSNVNVLVAGHASKTGPEPGNKTVARNRASVVKRFLAAEGVDPSKIIASGYGSEDPRVPNTTPENMAMNRRVEISRVPMV